MSPVRLESKKQPLIVDIRQRCSNFDLGKEVVDGMRCPPRSLPSLLLWDDQGLDYFDQFSQRSAYYPFHGEIEILRKYGSSIGSSIPSNGVLLELGCGSIRKTKLLLSGLRTQNRPVHYFALDVSRESLETSLGEMKREFEGCHSITVTGLLGTYDDCITWLSGVKLMQECRSVTIMFLGNSFGNMDSHEDASLFLARFRTACLRSHLACRFIISTDVCQNDTKILAAYDIREPALQNFLLNALESANLAFDRQVFNPADWTTATWLDSRKRTLHCYVTAKNDLSASLPVSDNEVEKVSIRKGERVQVITSGKWGKEAMRRISTQAGFQIQDHWEDDDGDYCKRSVPSYRRDN
ncbi:histidine-specific methyltransferase [Nemania sp. NC0429]|nr:histidine-specific methyltransferase [Nemania sp. NC0429]